MFGKFSSRDLPYSTSSFLFNHFVMVKYGCVTLSPVHRLDAGSLASLGCSRSCLVQLEGQKAPLNDGCVAASPAEVNNSTIVALVLLLNTALHGHDATMGLDGGTAADLVGLINGAIAGSAREDADGASQTVRSSLTPEEVLSQVQGFLGSQAALSALSSSLSSFPPALFALASLHGQISQLKDLLHLKILTSLLGMSRGSTPLSLTFSADRLEGKSKGVQFVGELGQALLRNCACLSVGQDAFSEECQRFPDTYGAALDVLARVQADFEQEINSVGWSDLAIQDIRAGVDKVCSVVGDSSALKSDVESLIGYYDEYVSKKKANDEEEEKCAAEAGAKADEAKEEEEFRGMTEAQIKKIKKKRAEKEAKRKKKAAAKAMKKAGVDGTGSLPEQISSSLSALKAAYSPSSSCQSSTLTRAATAVVEDVISSASARRKPKVAKGMRDYLPAQMAIRQDVFRKIRRVFGSHGAVEIDTPIMELKETLTGKYGEDTKLIYDLKDQGGEILALRYDLTVPFARFLALNQVGNIKRYHIGKVYRRDQPQMSRGRYREFYQCDFDIAGNYDRMVPDSECIAVAAEILSGLPIGDFIIKVNHRKLLDAILDISGVPSSKFRTICSAVDKLDKEPWEVVKAEMVEKGASEEVADRIGGFVTRSPMKNALDFHDKLVKEAAFGQHTEALTALEDLKIMFNYLEAMGKLKYVSFDLSLARGLDYYTGVIYEAVCIADGCQVGSIGGGGRYDGLAGMFSTKDIPCVGVSVGIERVFTLVEKNMESQKAKSNVDVLVASTSNNDTALLRKMQVTKMCWASHLSTEFTTKKLKFSIADALNRGIPFMVVVGDSEWEDGKVKIKSLDDNKEDEVKVDDMVNFLMAKGVTAVGNELGETLKSAAAGAGAGARVLEARPSSSVERKVFAWAEKDLPKP